MWRVAWKPAALKDLERLDRDMQRRILDALERLARGSRVDIKRLRGYENEWRLRVGEWRLRFIHTSDEIVVLRVLPRGSAYR